MRKEYKTIRVAYETKYWLNELLDFKEIELKEKKTDLVLKYELLLKQEKDFIEGFSPTLSISVTHGSVIEAAYNYANRNFEEIDWIQKRNDMEIAIKKINGKLDVGTLTPKFYLYTDVLDGLEEYQRKLKPEGMQRNLMLNFAVKLLVFAYHQYIFPEKYS